MSLSLSLVDRCWNCLFRTLFRSDFFYLVSKSIHIRRVELNVLSDYNQSSTYELIKYSYGLTILSVKYLKS